MLNLPFRNFLLHRARKQDVPQLSGGRRIEKPNASVDFIAKGGLDFVGLASHRGVLRALAGEYECKGTFDLVVRSIKYSCRVRAVQQVNCFCPVTAYQRSSECHTLSASLQGIGDVG